MSEIISNKLKIKVQDTLFSGLEKGTDLYQIFLYDIYYNLYDNLNRIKQLKLFKIQDFSEDYIGNQWFTYKPKYNNFEKTLSDSDFYSSYISNSGEVYDNVELSDIYEYLEDIKNNGEENLNFQQLGGELWVRLQNFPFAFPVSYNTLTNNEPIWEEVTLGEVYKCNVYGNMGYVYYKYQEKYHIIFFTISIELNKDDFYFTTNSFIDRLDNDITKDGESTLDEVLALKKSIQITVTNCFTFSNDSSQTFIDCIFYETSAFLFLTTNETFSSNPTIGIKKIPFEEDLVINRTLTYDTIVNLPPSEIPFTNTYDLRKNWIVSVSNDYINIAYATTDNE